MRVIFIFFVTLFSIGYSAIELERIGPDQMHLVPKSLEIPWERERGTFTFVTSEGDAGFSIVLDEEKWKMLSKQARAKFQKKEERYFFSSGAFENIEKSEELYYLPQRRMFEGASPSSMNVEELAKWIGSKNVVFYTGAGISAAAGIPTMLELAFLFPFDREGIEKAVHHPEKVLSKVQFFHQACYESFPTNAHRSLKAIALAHHIPLLTENLDHLHHKTGIKPFFISAGSVNNEVMEEKLKTIDAIICIGLSSDNRGLLRWYKELHPEGKLIAINKEQPSYLNNEDFLILGDVQTVFPNLQDLVRKKDL